MAAYLTYVSEPTHEDEHSIAIFTDNDVTVIDLYEDLIPASDALQAVIDLRMSDPTVQKRARAAKNRALALGELVFENTQYSTSEPIEFETEDDALEEAYRVRGILNVQ